MLAFERPLSRRSTSESLSRPELLDPAELGYVMAGFSSSLPFAAEVHRPLKEMITESLQQPGSLIRAQIAFPLLHQTPIGPERSRSLAVAIEYFHTASLIVDDMPMMDNATQRRGRLCPHLAFGEATALLGALALINQGYSLIWSVVEDLPRPWATRALGLVSDVLGVNGLLDGQSRDVLFNAEAQGKETIDEIASRKTVPLVRLALVLPALVSGARESTVDWLESLAGAWGLAYQLLDDFKDCLDSMAESGKSTEMDRRLGRPNLCNHLGLVGAADRLADLLKATRELLAAPPRSDWIHLDKLQVLLESQLSLIESKIEARSPAQLVSFAPRCRAEI